jgi:hypothetical protein
MSDFYKATRTRNIYDPKSKEQFKISRSKLDLFLNCPRCFYIDRRLGVGQPPGFPFNLNSAVDTLLKKEFDQFRAAQKPHPLFMEFQIDAIPFAHTSMDEWRDSLRRGIQFKVPDTNLTLTGGVDDVWINPKSKELMIVDYKATSKAGEVSLDADWQIGYKRQAEVYQWLFRQNGFKVSDYAYFVYCNGQTKAESFNKQLNFEIKVLPYKGDDSWVLKSVLMAYKCLQTKKIPKHSEGCDYCQYYLAVEKVTNASKS